MGGRLGFWPPVAVLLRAVRHRLRNTPNAYSAHSAAPRIVAQPSYTAFRSPRKLPDSRPVLRHRTHSGHERMADPNSRGRWDCPRQPSGRGGVSRAELHRNPDRYPDRLCCSVCRTRDRLAPNSIRWAALGQTGRSVHILTVSGQTCQMSSQYSAIARSDENLPLRAVFRIDIFVHDSPSSHAALTSSWHSR
jgi:hypothetical protein